MHFKKKRRLNEFKNNLKIKILSRFYTNCVYDYWCSLSNVYGYICYILYYRILIQLLEKILIFK